MSEEKYELKQDPELLSIFERIADKKSDDGTVWMNMFVCFASKESLAFGNDAERIANLSAIFADEGLKMFNKRFNQ